MVEDHHVEVSSDFRVSLTESVESSVTLGQEGSNIFVISKLVQIEFLLDF